MRTLVCCILIVIGALQTLSKNMLWADYLWSPARYEMACMNKANPTMHCKGKCQLMKRMQQQEKQDQKSPGRNNNEKEDTLFSESYPPLISLATQPDNNEKFPVIISAMAIGVMKNIFHPPTRA